MTGSGGNLKSWEATHEQDPRISSIFFWGKIFAIGEKKSGKSSLWSGGKLKSWEDIHKGAPENPQFFWGKIFAIGEIIGLVGLLGNLLSG